MASCAKGYSGLIKDLHCIDLQFAYNNAGLREYRIQCIVDRMEAVLEARDIPSDEFTKRDDLKFHPEIIRDTFRLYTLVREAPSVRVPFMILEEDSIGQWSFLTEHRRDTLERLGYRTLQATISNTVVIEPVGYEIINSEIKQLYDLYHRKIVVFDPDSLTTELPADFDLGNKPCGVFLEKSYS